MQRFIRLDIDDALEELKAGHKKTHWMWYVFPQLKSLGHSLFAQYYGIEDLSEAKEFLANQYLSRRLKKCCELLLTHKGKNIYDIMGSEIDCIKLKSSMTLFFLASETDDNIFAKVIDEFFYGELDTNTLKALKGQY